MKRFEGCLLATDFDGTLNDDHGATPPSVMEAIRYYCDNGGYFTACTGRTYQGMQRYAHMSLFNAPVLLSNGAMAFDYRTQKTVFLHGIGDEGVPFVRALCVAFPDVSVEMYPFDKTFAVQMSADSERHFTNQGIEYTCLDDPEDAPRPWAKVMIGCPPGRSAAVQDFLRGRQELSFLETTGNFVEVLRPGVHKGSGLLYLADLLHVPHTRVFSAGDGYNDVDMLRASACAFVPCNASAEALRAATHVVRSNNDGAIAHAIEILDAML